MELLTPVRHLHVVLALLSGALFATRGATLLVLRRRIRSRSARIVPHVVDTALLLSGLTLAIAYRHSPLAVPWFGFKLLLLTVYIALGIGAFRVRHAAAAWSLFIAALLTWLWIVGVAMHRHPLGWLA